MNKMGKYHELAEFIIKNVGGRENIISVTHCVTRLRFNLKDESLAKDDVLKNADGIVTIMKAGGQYQVVIGNHVPDVYKEVCETAGISTEDVTKSDKKMSFKDKAFDLISGIMLPSIAILSASGIIKGLNTILFILGLYSMESSYYVLINAIGDAMFFFFPIILGYNTAKKLKVNPFLGLVTGMILCYPAINGVDMDFSGFTMNATYTSSVLPVILIVALEAPLERFFNKVVPDVIKTFIVPMLVMLIAVPIGYVIIGPIANSLGMIVGQGINTLIQVSPTVAGIIVGGFWQLFVLFGIHMVLLIPSMTNVISGVPDTFMALISCVSFAQTAVVLAIWLKTKDKKLKNIAFPAWISGIFGVTEPAIYGVTLPRLKMFIISCLGGALGGGILGFLGSKIYTMAGMGLFSLPGYINSENGDTSGVLSASIAIVISMVVSFVAAFVLYKDDKMEEKIEDKSLPMGKEVLSSPLDGQVISLNQVKDDAFSTEIMGKGIAIRPTNGKVFSPCNGTILTVFPTKHAIGIVSENGAEILIHIGMDTVKLDGKYLTVLVEKGQKIKKGDLLVEFDKDAIEKSGYSTETPIIITNSNDYLDIISMKTGDTTAGDELLTLLC